MKRIILLAIALTAMAFIKAQTSQRLPEYDQARKFTEQKLKTMLFSTQVRPHWMPSGEGFWYEYKTSKGTEWIYVNPSRKEKKPLFDKDWMAAQLSLITHDPIEAAHLPIEQLEAKEDGTFEFSIKTHNDIVPDSTNVYLPSSGQLTYFFSYNPQNRQLTHLKNKWKSTPYPEWASISPDGKTIVFARDFNLYRMSREDYEAIKENDKKEGKHHDKHLDSLATSEIQLTQFGVKDFGFGMPYSYLNTDTLDNGKRKRVRGMWSPDSKHFAIIVTDSRKVKDLWVINAMASPRPTLETYKYEMPGEKDVPQDHLYIFDMTDNSYKEIRCHAFKDQWLDMDRTPLKRRQYDQHEQAVVWKGDNNHFYVNRYSRDLHRIDICQYTIGEDSLRPVITERMNTYQEIRPLGIVNGGKELIQWSERNGWAHLYLYDQDGQLKRPLTQGSWHVMDILHIDEKNRLVYFTANGFHQGENPYYQHLFKVSLDGGQPQEITSGSYFHNPIMDDEGKYFVDNYSNVECAPRTSLISTEGKQLLLLEEADMTELLANGYQYPEQFVVKAADGVTDLWGVMYKPFNFDSTKVYPIIDYVYPGPQVEATEYVFTPMRLRTDRLAQAGFIVITVGNRGGHPNRSKWYHNYGYGNLRDYGLADQKAAIEQLANRHSFIDINNVGIHGHSGGGFMSTAAILSYPNFFKAAVSCAGNHDNNIYNRWWSETHHGVKEKISAKGDTSFVYQISTNPQIASQLKGHLLLVHGDIDNNVHPGNTTRVVDALIKAGKRFDMLVLPEQRHGFGPMNEYFYWRMVDYFSEHLKGRKEGFIDIPELVR